MYHWFHIFPKNTGLSLYAWIAFCILPFYFIIRSSTLYEIIVGVTVLILFFTIYRLSFVKQGWTVYVALSFEMVISIGMTIYFGFVYFALFIAFFIGNVKSKAGFISLYVVHLSTTVVAFITGFLIHSEIFIAQIPFNVLGILGVILLPFTIYHRNRREELEGQLRDANERISQLMVMEERQRIARDLHDTLGQKLSLIGLKSDLASKLLSTKPDLAKQELDDINQTSRTALSEVREIVSNMRTARLEDEMVRVQELLTFSQIECEISGEQTLNQLPLLVEDVFCMCLRESVTNVVKHSQSSTCKIQLNNLPDEWRMIVQDDGIGIKPETPSDKKSGMKGMKERLEFVNGKLDVNSKQGTQLVIRIPRIIHQTEGGLR
ncbi:sensor histidine kinase [Geomicrobium sediminis]|uniref:histidine kinase n=1 Tax=Geomicrobium sediminis TaxID=1347788 RepID=A0ABS2P7W2_9BACL|nr:sensor histidine kinase [Geomicrobium sediminis]MBM7630928.1 two-component system sensor histidine kinase DesK [Geomicrobium sediminis]